tara:strand:+ start:145 stop:531 length:387 start_codon:yes stop_codon:yes gene_type:complete
VSILIYLTNNDILGGFPKIIDIKNDLLLFFIFFLVVLVYSTTKKEDFYGWVPISTRLIQPTANMSYDLRGDPIVINQSTPPYVNKNYYGSFIYRLFPYMHNPINFLHPIWNKSPIVHPLINHKLYLGN